MSRKNDPLPHPWLTLDAVEAAIPAMEATGAAEVARGAKPSSVTPIGFIEAYRYAHGDPDVMAEMPATAGQSWAQRRADFVHRHMAQVEVRGEPLFDGEGNPTRRHLGLIAWAYSPPQAAAALERWYQDGPNSTRRRSRRNNGTIEPPDRRKVLQTLMLPPVAPELAGRFMDLVYDYDASAKMPGLALSKAHAEAVPLLVGDGFLRIVKTHPPGAWPWEMAWKVFEIKRTKKGDRAVEVMRQAKTDLDREFRQTYMFGARPNGRAARRSAWDSLDRLGAEIQTVLFDADRWTRATAARWLREHALWSDDADDGVTVIRFRQQDPKRFRPQTFRTIPMGEYTGIQAVVGIPKG